MKQQHKPRPKNAINLYFLQNTTPSLEALIAALQKERIQVVVRKNDQSVIYGMTYVDHQSKCVFNGSELGKQYSSNVILQRCNPRQVITGDQTIKQEHSIGTSDQLKKPQLKEQNSDPMKNHIPPGKNLFQELMQSSKAGSLASELLAENQRKKRKKIRQ